MRNKTKLLRIGLRNKKVALNQFKVNKKTLKAIENIENRKGLIEIENLEDLFKKLGI